MLLTDEGPPAKVFIHASWPFSKNFMRNIPLDEFAASTWTASIKKPLRKFPATYTLLLSSVRRATPIASDVSKYLDHNNSPLLEYRNNPMLLPDRLPTTKRSSCFP